MSVMSDDTSHEQTAGAVTESTAYDNAPLQAAAEQVRAVLEAWSARLVESVASGRAATRMARMATARAAAELRRVPLPDAADSDPALRQVLDAYLRRATSTVANASHDIERNRYTLQAMQNQLEKLAALHQQIVSPGGDAAPDEPANSGPGDTPA